MALTETQPTKKVPLINSSPISEFGEAPEDSFTDPYGQDRDGSYVPGFSEMRKQHDKDVGAYLRGEINRDAILQLPVNLRWARNQDKAGKPDSAKPFSHSRKGYRYVDKTMLNSDWLKEVPGGTQWDAEGHLRNGDMVLMVCDKAQAAKNEQNKRREVQSRMDSTSNVFSQRLAEAGIRSDKGTSPAVEQMAPDQAFFNGDKK